MAKKKVDTIEAKNLTVGQILEESQKEASKEKNGPSGAKSEKENSKSEKPKEYYGELIDTVMSCYESLQAIESNEGVSSLEKDYFDDLVLETTETMPILRGQKDSFFPLTEVSSAKDVSVLAKVPAIFGLGAALITNTLNSLFGEGSSFAKFIGSKATVSATDSGETPHKFKGMLAAIGSDIQALGIGLLAISAAAVAFNFVDIGSIGLMLLTVSGLGLIVTGLAALSKKLVDEGLRERLEPLTEALGDVGIALAAASASLLVASLAATAIMAIGIGPTLATLIGVVSLTAIAIAGSALLVNNLKATGVSIEALQGFGETILAIGKTMMIMAGVLAVSAIISMLNLSQGTYVVFGMLFGLTTALLFGVAAAARIANATSGEAIDKLGNTMLKVGATMLIVGGVLALSALLTPLITNGLLGIALVVGITVYLMTTIVGVAKMATDETIKALNALSMAMLAAGAMFAIVGVTMLIVSKIPITPGTMVALGFLLATTALIMFGMSYAIKAAKDIDLVSIGKTVLVLGLGIAVLAGVAATIALVAQFDPENVKMAIASIVIMLGLTVVLGLAMAALGTAITPLLGVIVGGAAVTLVVVGAVGLVVAGLTGMLSIAIKNITESGINVSEAAETTMQIAKLIGGFAIIAASIVTFAAFGVLAIPASFIVALAMPAIGEAIKRVGEAAKLGFNDEVLEAYESVNADAIFNITSALVGITSIGILLTMFASPLLAAGIASSLAIPGLLLMKDSLLAAIPTFQAAAQLGEMANVMESAILAVNGFSLFAGHMLAASLKIVAAAAILSNIDLNSKLEIMKEAAINMAATTQALGTTNIANGFNELHTQIASIQFGLADALKLGAAVDWASYALNKFSKLDVPKISVKVDALADSFNKLAAVVTPMRELANALNEVSAAANNLNAPNAGKVSDSIKVAAQSAEGVHNQLIATKSEQSNLDFAWKEKALDVLQKMESLLQNISKSSKSTMYATLENNDLISNQ